MQRKLVLDMLGAVYWFTDALNSNMEAQGFPRTTRAISFILMNVAHGEHRAINISRNLGISRQAVSLMLLELRDRGMLEIREDPNDRRSQIVDFSPKFAKQGAACAEIIVKLEKEIGRRIGVQKLKALREALSEDWGQPPIFNSLSSAELLRGKAEWNKKDENGRQRKAAPPRSQARRKSARAKQ